jgi:hypothetical protein
MPRVFVSYSRDSPEHAARVLALAQQLRDDGVDAIIDTFVTGPKQGWTRWVVEELAAAEFVLIVVSAGYRNKTEHQAPRSVRRGVEWESHLSVQEIYDADARTQKKIIPVLLEGIGHDALPTVLRAWTWYQMPEGYDDLLRRLYDKPKVLPAPLGSLRQLAALRTLEKETDRSQIQSAAELLELRATIYRMASRRGLPHPDADLVAQDAMLASFNKGLKGEEFARYAIGITRNLIAGFHRRRYNDPAVIPPNEAADEADFSFREIQWLGQKLPGIIDSLEEDDRTILKICLDWFGSDPRRGKFGMLHHVAQKSGKSAYRAGLALRRAFGEVRVRLESHNKHLDEHSALLRLVGAGDFAFLADDHDIASAFIEALQDPTSTVGERTVNVYKTLGTWLLEGRNVPVDESLALLERNVEQHDLEVLVAALVATKAARDVLSRWAGLTKVTHARTLREGRDDITRILKKWAHQ